MLSGKIRNVQQLENVKMSNAAQHYYVGMNT